MSTTFPIGESDDVDGDEHVAMVWLQPGHRVEHLTLHHALVGPLAHSGLGAVVQLVELRGRDPARACAEVVDVTMSQGREEVSEVAVAGDLLGTSQELEEEVLDEVVRVVTITREHRRGAIQAGEMDQGGVGIDSHADTLRGTRMAIIGVSP